MPGTATNALARGVIITRRLSVIVALGAMLGMFAGVLTASTALAGRGTTGTRGGYGQ